MFFTRNPRVRLKLCYPEDPEPVISADPQSSHSTSLTQYNDNLYGPYKYEPFAIPGWVTELVGASDLDRDVIDDLLITAQDLNNLDIEILPMSNCDSPDTKLVPVQKCEDSMIDDAPPSPSCLRSILRRILSNMQDLRRKCSINRPLMYWRRLWRRKRKAKPTLPKVEISGGDSYEHDYACMINESGDYVLEDYALETLETDYATWVVDSGCSVHCVPDASYLTSVTQTGSDRPLRVANGKKVHVEPTGVIDMDVRAVTPDGRSVTDRITLHRVLVVPSFKNLLFSCSAAHKHDALHTVLNGENDGQGYIELPSGNRILFEPGGQYKFVMLEADPDPGQSVQVVNDDAEHGGAHGDLQHRRLAHFPTARLTASGVQADHTDCEACMLNLRRTKMPSKSRAQRNLPPCAIQFGQLVHSDLLEMPDSIEGYSYICSFVDEYSNEAALRFLRSKTSGAVLQALQSCVASNQHLMDGGRVATWHTDNGGEFDSSAIDAYCNAVSTRQSKTPARTPEMNGKAERLNGIIIRGVRTLLAASNLTEGLWPYAATQVVAIHNRLVSRALIPPMSPYERNRGRKPNLQKYRVWGCKAFVQMEKEERAKFGLLKTDPAGMLAVHLGYDHMRRGYYVYIPQIKRYTTVYTIKFKEDEWVHVPELERHERVVPARKRLERSERERVARWHQHTACNHSECTAGG